LTVQSPNKEDNDAPIEVFVEDTTSKELRGLNKVSFLQHSTPLKAQNIMFITCVHLSYDLSTACIDKRIMVPLHKSCTYALSHFLLVLNMQRISLMM
jgi:hypothetical protein